ncbi:hypothetical protein UB44_13780 [Burkholderiaceae bacterium 26]|nr:hypothetical protein UB44_13780 [Burkholderiaceae bacterium 26]
MSSVSNCSDLSHAEKLYYRDRIREARYSALADAEGFESICFALEALGLRLNRKQGDMGRYREELKSLSSRSSTLEHLPVNGQGYHSSFDALYHAVSSARNDAMHTGVYARSVTQKAMELCIGLEEALMADLDKHGVVADYMVKSPISVQPWRPVAHARQLMLMHSISYLPIRIESDWLVLSETAVLRYLGLIGRTYNGPESHARKERLGTPILNARPRLQLSPAALLVETAPLEDLMAKLPGENSTGIWLVLDDLEDTTRRNLVGVITPFDLL